MLYNSDDRDSRCPCSRVALTDFKGKIILDCYVAPTFPVTDYRYKVTGITAADLGEHPLFSRQRRFTTCFVYTANASEFSQVQRRVADMIRNKTIVGHQLWNDLSGNGSLIHLMRTVGLYSAR